jgi:hypothetical protein
MSLNITSDGSPTPRKQSRFPIGDLRVDTSPELLGMAVGSRHPFPSRMHQSTTAQRFGNASLTSATQGVRRPGPTETSVPLMTSTRDNQVQPTHMTMEGYKVRLNLFT